MKHLIENEEMQTLDLQEMMEVNGGEWPYSPYLIGGPTIIFDAIWATIRARR